MDHLESLMIRENIEDFGEVAGIEGTKYVECE